MLFVLTSISDAAKCHVWSVAGNDVVPVAECTKSMQLQWCYWMRLLHAHHNDRHAVPLSLYNAFNNRFGFCSYKNVCLHISLNFHIPC